MGTITDKRQLCAALHAAAELEHALCCCYLFAAFSLKRSPDEGGVDWPQLKEIRNWATQLLIVARQEMEHLGLVCNLLMAIGETPNFKRSRFPYRARWPSEFPELTLTPFNADTIRRFVEFERPDFEQLSRMIAREIGGQNLTEALARTVKLICSQTGWEYGQGWLVDEATGSVQPASIPTLSPEAKNARPTFERLVRDKLVRSFKERSHSKFWQGRLDPSTILHHHKNAEFFGRAFSFGRPVSGKPTAALVFFYCTHCEAIDDFTAEKLVKDALNLCRNNDVFAPLAVDAVWTEIVARQAEFEEAMNEPARPATIGAVYREILKAFEKLDDGTLFVGSRGGQVDDKILKLTFPDWFNMEFRTVSDLESAKAVINQIIKEGEGTPSYDATALDQEKAVDLGGSVSHFARFSAVYQQLEAMQGPSFFPARDLACNPKSSQATIANTAELMSIFNQSYALMLELLLGFFHETYGARSNSKKLGPILPRIFVPIMSMVVRTLGEMLTLCPMDEGRNNIRAGPGFELDSPIEDVPADDTGWQAYYDKLCTLSERCRDLSRSTDDWGEVQDLETVRERLLTAANNLQRMAYNLKTGVEGGTSAAPGTTR